MMALEPAAAVTGADHWSAVLTLSALSRIGLGVRPSTTPARVRNRDKCSAGPVLELVPVSKSGFLAGSVTDAHSKAALPLGVLSRIVLVR